MDKLRVIQDYEKLSKELQEQVKLVYPEGYSQHLIVFTNSKGERVSALPFETFDKIYLIRMSVSKADQIISDDNDYNDDGLLKESTREKYEDKHSDVEYLSENENYEENYVDDDIDDDD
ncbi:MAG: hypothetical protein K9J13_06540 [Saprospiraceae bacterium]|nr:hypothetical protein [Saprospiraceae bacterium]